MSVAIYLVFHILAIFLHLIDPDYTARIFLYATAIPIIDYIALIIKHRKLTFFHFLRSSSFIAIAFVNFYSFSYWHLPGKWLVLIWIIIAFLGSVYLRLSLVKKYLTRWIIFTFLIFECVLNSTLPDINRMHLYTIDDPPTFSAEMTTKKLIYFSYLYQKHGNRDMAIYLLKQACQNIRIKMKDKTLTAIQKDALRTEFNEASTSINLLLQNKWVIKDKFTE